MEMKCSASVSLTGHKSISTNNMSMYKARNSLLGEKGSKLYIGRARHRHTNYQWGALAVLVSPRWPCSLPQPCKGQRSSHISPRQVCKRMDSTSTVPASTPTPSLPLVGSPHLLQTRSLQLVSVLSHRNISHRTVLPATLSNADDTMSDMFYLSYCNSSLTSPGKWLGPGPHLSTFRSISAYRKSNNRENHCTSLTLFMYDTDQYMQIFLVVANSRECLVSNFCSSSFIKYFIAPIENWNRLFQSNENNYNYFVIIL